MKRESPLAALAGHIYGLMLFAYPVPFRREFGPHMAQVFRDDMRGTLQENGPLGLCGLWLITFFDLIKTALAEHIWEIFNMPADKLTRWSGLAAALGAPLLYMTFGSQTFWRTYASLGLPDGDIVHPILAGSGLLLMGIGLYGLYRLLPAGIVSKLGLIVALAGIVLGIVAMIVWIAGDDVLSGSFALPVFLLPPLGLALMGGVALKHRSLGRLSFVPVAIFACFIALALFLSADPADVLAQLFLVLTFLGWIVLGAAIALNHSAVQPSEPGLFA